MRCLSVCVSVTFVDSVNTNKHIFKFFHHRVRSQSILVFPQQTARQYFDRNLPRNGGVKCRCGRRQKLRCDSEPISGLTACRQRCDRPGVINTALPDHGPASYDIAGSKRRNLLMAGDDDEMFMRRSLNFTPKTTEQRLIARSDKSVAYVTNNKRLCALLDVL